MLDSNIPLFMFLVSGNFSAWSEWSNCSTSCGNGVIVRSRSCNTPAPTFGGQDCTSLGPPIDQRNCIKESCSGMSLLSCYHMKSHDCGRKHLN